ncbi:MAG: Holliday junction branch migration protein RuvA [Clostridia bacterium]|nr:Holliday junction branch migration protein RuvA [Clostridia bacterium]
MIGYIKGEAIIIDENTVIMECNGLGYEVTVSGNTVVKIQNGTPYICLYTYLKVSEDDVTLYGFYTKEEKNMFLKLLSVNGIGPKAAIGILSGIELNDLMIAIMSSDVKRLSKVKGIGKKTAERIVLELKEKIDAGSAELMESIPTGIGVSTKEEEIDKDSADVIIALRGLGLKQEEALEAVRQAKPHCNTAEEMLVYILKNR